MDQRLFCLPGLDLGTSVTSDSLLLISCGLVGHTAINIVVAGSLLCADPGLRCGSALT